MTMSCIGASSLEDETMRRIAGACNGAAGASLWGCAKKAQPLETAGIFNLDPQHLPVHPEQRVTTSYDEMVTGTGSLRSHWRALLEAVSALSAEQWAEKRARISGQMAEDDELVALPEHGAVAHGRTVDPLPLILPEKEWQHIAAGIVQRARLLDSILADLYGPQRLIEDHHLPPYLVLGNPAFLRPLRGVRPIGAAPRLHFYAADLVRLPTGEWRIYADRTQAAAGAGYALHIRNLLTRNVPELFRAARAQRLHGFVELWQDSLGGIAGKLSEAPHIVLLTPGPYNDAYFEHVLLARALGITLVQSADLTVRESYVYLKTLDGLAKVDLIYRRVDGDYCDSLELREESALGVAGLVEVARAGHVAILNMPGTALVETSAMAPFLPELARRLHGEELTLPAVTTWWCGQGYALEVVRASLDRFALHSIFEPDPAPVEPVSLGDADRARFEMQLLAFPQRYVAREILAPSLAPCLADTVSDGRRYVPKPVVLRVMAAWRDGEWFAMPGGLARVVTDNSIYRHRMHEGGIAKDVWVLSAQDRDAALPLAQAVTPRAPAQEVTLRSRTADDLFWLGRQVERLESGARQFLATIQRLASGNVGAREQAELQRLTEALKRTGWITFAVAGAPVTGSAFRDGVANAAGTGMAMRDSIDAIRRLTLATRDQLSPDIWRRLHHLTGVAAARFGRQRFELDTVLQALDDMIATIAAFAGLVAENMVRGTGWRFLDIGRRIERGIATAQTMRGVMSGPAAQNEAGYRLAIELCDSVLAYRRRHLFAGPNFRALSFVLAERGNPRALIYQLASIEEHLAAPVGLRGIALDGAIVRPLIEAVEEFARSSDQDGEPVQPAAPAFALLERAAADLMDLSDRLTRTFFTHTLSAPLMDFSQRLTLAAP
jgi:uncharacterized circularly permuted ATP-grasp superfamily protein/uncharacterized alpha-E superfamily protein